jgi:hypothetical protein
MNENGEKNDNREVSSAQINQIDRWWRVSISFFSHSLFVIQRAHVTTSLFFLSI